MLERRYAALVKSLRRLGMCAVLLLLVAGCTSPIAGAARPAPSPDRSAHDTSQAVALVRRAFTTYKRAALEQDGAAAVSVISRTIYARYDKARDMALRATAAEVDGAGASMQLLVYVFRAEVGREALQRKSARELIVFAIDNGLVSKHSLRLIELGAISVTGRRASAEVILHGKTAPFNLEFQHNGAGWKLDMRSILSVADKAFRALAKQSGITVAELVERTLIRRYGPAKAAELREPLIS